MFPMVLENDLAALPSAADVAEVRLALASLRTSFGAGAVSASRTINPLLDLWALTTAVDRCAAIPIEALLTVLVRRSITTTAEMAEMADRVEQMLQKLEGPSD